MKLTNIKTFYIFFHPPAWGLRILGHVQIGGCTDEDDWFFFNPSAKGSLINLVHRKTEVEAWLATLFEETVVLRLEGEIDGKTPLLPAMTCASIIGHMLGVRAFTPWGLKRQLLRNGAEEVYDGTRPERSSVGSSEAGAPSVGAGTEADGSEDFGQPNL